MKRFYGFAFFERIGGEFDKIKIELRAPAFFADVVYRQAWQ